MKSTHPSPWSVPLTIQKKTQNKNIPSNETDQWMSFQNQLTNYFAHIHITKTNNSVVSLFITV